MVTYIKCFGVIKQGANERESLAPYYGRVLYSVSKSWSDRHGKHRKDFFAVTLNRAKFNTDDDSTYYELLDSVAVSILANCSIVHTVEL